jgi:hypothetical protein
MFLKRDAGLGKLNCEGKRFKAGRRDMEERLRRVLGLNFGATLSGNFSPDLIPSAGKRAYAALVL